MIMGIPDFQSIMLPLLQTLAGGEVWAVRDLTKSLADSFKLTDDERSKLLPSGQQSVFGNRVAWAKTDLKMARLIDSPSRGLVRISDEGKKVLASKPAKITRAFLRQFPAYDAFFTKRPEQPDDVAESDQQIVAAEGAHTPEELLESSYATLRSALAEELLDRVKSCSPAFFEQLVVRLLVAMGYGGTLADAAQVIGKSGDGGIDGTIKEDKLGLDIVCVQAKRWENTVGRPVVQAFAGSMEGFRARKGVLITTATFSAEAKEYVNKIERKIVLIDGPTLANYMMDYDIGVSMSRSFIVKKIDLDYFEES
jgi:restriction system protein